MNYCEKYIKYKNKYNNLKILSGGMKIVINNIVSRNTITIEQFENIFRYATNIEIVSVNSVTGFIFRITIPENITPFRSDIIDIDNNKHSFSKMLADSYFFGYNLDDKKYGTFSLDSVGKNMSDIVDLKNNLNKVVIKYKKTMTISASLIGDNGVILHNYLSQNKNETIKNTTHWLRWFYRL